MLMHEKNMCDPYIHQVVRILIILSHYFFIFFFSVEKFFYQNDLLTCILKGIFSELREHGTDFFEVNVSFQPLLYDHRFR